MQRRPVRSAPAAGWVRRDGLRPARSVAAAPYVEATLARRALQRGDLGAAQHYALRLPASPSRDALLGDVASANGARTSRAGVLDRCGRFRRYRRGRATTRGARSGRRVRSGANLRACARGACDASRCTRAGPLADGPLREPNRVSRDTGSPAQRRWLRRALGDFEAAAELAPLSERYAIAAANQADLLAERDVAERLFRHAVEIDPGSADALAGLGVVALERGDVATARSYLVRARADDPASPMVRALERELH